MEEKYMIKNGKRLRCGYTTGSCATAAAAAAAEMLLTGKTISQAAIRLPDGETVLFDVEEPEIRGGQASCAIIKDSGDDPDVTHGLAIRARVQKDEEPGIRLTRGPGVGQVTMKGLQIPPGEPAINPVPRKMIRENVEKICADHRYEGGLTIEISAPGGEEIAQKTFNPRLGIVGGISILGTTGVVEPMSEKALVDTIRVEIDKRYEEDPEKILIAPGNYGRAFCLEELGLDIEHSAQISNYVGEALDYIKYKGFREILFVGHTGKLLKVAAGVMNTHSSYADCRMEIIAAHSACLGASPAKVQEIMKCLTTDDAFELIREEPYFEGVKERILAKALDHLNFRLKNEVKIEIVMFTTSREHIIMSDGAEALIAKFKEEQA